jgi:hypothetical protein
MRTDGQCMDEPRSGGPNHLKTKNHPGHLQDIHSRLLGEATLHGPKMVKKVFLDLCYYRRWINVS